MNGSEKTSKYRKYVPKYGVKNSDNRSAFGKYVPAFVFIVFIFINKTFYQSLSIPLGYYIF